MAEIRLENVTKDYAGGIRAVDSAGRRSPVAFPTDVA